MKADNRKYYILMVSQLVVCVVFVACVCLFSKHYHVNTQHMIRESALNMTETTLRERVETIISHIETKKKQSREEAGKLATSVARALADNGHSPLESQIEHWMTALQRMEYGQPLAIYVEDSLTGGVTRYQGATKSDVTAKFAASSPDACTAACPIRESFSRGSQKIHIIATQQALDTLVKKYIYDLIHRTAYGENGYVWVNEVRNYAGGAGLCGSPDPSESRQHGRGPVKYKYP
ncbi:MAG: hypothetical protein Q4F27_04750 [Desulfovibrionaceae bacterium]|nr:hypothetical protein [Desulfovibrionaceae bacterium]